MRRPHPGPPPQARERERSAARGGQRGRQESAGNLVVVEFRSHGKRRSTPSPACGGGLGWGCLRALHSWRAPSPPTTPKQVLPHAIRPERPKAPRALQGADILRAAAADRVGYDDRADGRGQRRAVQFLQRVLRRSAAVHVRRQSAARWADQGHRDQHPPDRRVRGQHDRRGAGAGDAREQRRLPARYRRAGLS